MRILKSAQEAFVEDLLHPVQSGQGYAAEYPARYLTQGPHGLQPTQVSRDGHQVWLECLRIPQKDLELYSKALLEMMACRHGMIRYPQDLPEWFESRDLSFYGTLQLDEWTTLAVAEPEHVGLRLRHPSTDEEFFMGNLLAFNPNGVVRVDIPGAVRPKPIHPLVRVMQDHLDPV